MSFTQGGKDDQRKLMYFPPRTHEEFQSDESEQEEEEEEDDVAENLGKIGEDVTKAKEIQMKMAECKDVSIGPTTNYIFNLNDTLTVAYQAFYALATDSYGVAVLTLIRKKLDININIEKDAANLALLLRTTPNESSLSNSISHVPTQLALNSSGVGPSSINAPRISASESNAPYCHSSEAAELLKDAHSRRTFGNSTSLLRALLLDESPSGICHNDNSHRNTIPLRKILARTSEAPITKATSLQLSSISTTSSLNTKGYTSECIQIPRVKGQRFKPINSRQVASHSTTVKSQSFDKSTLRSKQSNKWKRLTTDIVMMGGYAVGIEPGKFFESRFDEGCYIVEMRNGTEYRIKLANNTILRCNVDVYVDGKFVAALQMNSGDRQTLQGPLTTDEECGRFMFLRASDAPEEAEINPKSEENGIVMVEFVPELMSMPSGREDTSSSSDCEEFETYSASSPGKYTMLSGSPTFCAGATALIGRQEQRDYVVAENIRVDKDNSVTIILRLVARRTDELFIPQNNEPIKPLRSTRRPPPFDP